MSIHTRIILLIALILWILPNSLFSQYSETIYDIEDGLTHNTVLDITSDENGFIWVFTTSGVCRFDGHRFKEYKAELNRRLNTISYQGWFMKDSKGRIWIESSLPALLVYDNDLDRVNVASEIQYHSFSDLADDGNGNFIFTNYEQIFNLHENSDLHFNAKAYDVPEEAGMFYYIHQLEDGSTLASGPNGLFKLLIDEGVPRVEKINLMSSAGSTLNPTDVLNFLPDDHHFYFFNGKQILSTGVAGTDFLTDSGIHVEPLILDFPEIGLTPGQPLYSVISDRNGALFIRSINGIYRLDPEKGTAERIRVESYGEIDTGEGDFKAAMYYDKEGILWVGTDQGLLKIVIGNKPFHNIPPEPDNPNGLRSGKLKSVLIDSRGHLWVGTVEDGLFHSIPDSTGQFRSFTNYLPDSEDPSSIHASYVAALFEDSQQRLWVGTDNIQWMDLKGKPGVFYEPQATTFAEQIGKGLYPEYILEDPEGNILVLSLASPSWLITPDGNKSYWILLDSARNLCNWPFIRYTGDGTGYLFNDRRFYQINSGWTLNEDGTDLFPRDSLWIHHYKNRTLTPWTYPNLTDTLINFDSLDVLIARFLISEKENEKELWLSLECRNKVFRSDLDRLKAQARSSNLNDITYYTLIPEQDNRINYIFDLFQDKHGVIWGTQRDGLVRIDPATEECSYYFDDDGLPTNRFYWGHDISEDGTIYASSTDGLVYFHPDSIYADLPPEVRISDLRFNYKTVTVDGQNILKRSILKTDQIKLKHNQNFLGFEFSAFSYRNSERIQYKYQLKGVDEDWIKSDERHTVDYPNLNPGRYTFRVIAANGNGVWNMKGTSMDIHIQPPLWFRWWAIVLEGLIFLLLLLQYIRYRERNLKKQALILEQTVEEKTHQILEQRKEVDEMKSRFYTNISHEFRTPLTLLISPIDDALKNGQEEITVSRRIMEIMMRNARRLQRLINQLLDISKLESGKMELQLVKASLSDFVRTVASAFLSLAESRGIQFDIHIGQEITETCFDTDKMEKIISNLLSNAFKFCDQGGEVSLRLEYESNEHTEKPAQAFLSIKDTGKGIDKEQLDKIFDRFYQVSDTETREVEGSGIGLALTKELVELMHGSIKVESAPGKGTTFKLAFPVSEECFSEHELEKMKSAHSEGDALVKNDIDRIEPGDIPDKMFDLENSSGPIVDMGPGVDNEEELILIVEDNPDLRSYICDKFGKQYRVLEAENGKDGLEKAIEHIPDLVITDLMMPEMGGVEMCRRLKEHPNTNHIPLIMLTAKADKDSRLEGLEASADDYISKPFDTDLLLARARNLITQRKELRKHFEKELILSHNETHTSSQRVRMLKEIIKVIDENLDDPDFDLATMTAHLHMSRAGIYRKVKAISGTTPHELLRLVRMKRAAAMLRTGEMNVTQVMYSVGMRNLSNFAISFRKYFGVNPGDYKDM
ncbi:MAG: ATP-binding protein [Bacteroides sp.]|nr:ATP-binding protein [Bacteroides sp.]